MKIIIRQVPKAYTIQSDSESFQGQELELVTRLRSYITNMYAYGVEPETTDGFTNVELINDAVKDFKVRHFLMLCAVPGISVELFKPLIQVAETDIDNPVPEGIGNRTYFMPTGEIDPDTEENIRVEMVHTWRTWRDEGHYLKPAVDGYYIFPSTPFGKALTQDDLMLIHAAPEAQLIDA